MKSQTASAISIGTMQVMSTLNTMDDQTCLFLPRTYQQYLFFCSPLTENSTYFEKRTTFEDDARAELQESKEITFYDSNTGKPLFFAPRGRTFDQFLKESKNHGWPSFRDEEVNWEFVRCLRDGEAVSSSGTHLGHNLPDSKGNRYCINLVSVAGKPVIE